DRLARWDGMKLSSSAAIYETAGGRVGVGVPEPQLNLDVDAGVRVSRAGSTQAVEMRSGSFGNLVQSLSPRGNMKPLDFYAAYQDDGRPMAGSLGFRWWVGPFQATTLAMLVDANGRVGIGNSAP